MFRQALVLSYLNTWCRCYSSNSYCWFKRNFFKKVPDLTTLKLSLTFWMLKNLLRYRSIKKMHIMAKVWYSPPNSAKSSGIDRTCRFSILMLLLRSNTNSERMLPRLGNFATFFEALSRFRIEKSLGLSKNWNRLSASWTRVSTKENLILKEKSSKNSSWMWVSWLPFLIGPSKGSTFSWSM